MINFLIDWLKVFFSGALVFFLGVSYLAIPIVWLLGIFYQTNLTLVVTAVILTLVILLEL